MSGFFPDSSLAESKAPPEFSPRCSQCKLNKTCINPKIPLDGLGKRKILVVGEAPGKDEDKQNRPFVGNAGTYLRDTLYYQCGVELRRDCWIRNAANCRPPNDDLPPKAIDYCRPLVIDAIKDHQPEVIILLGASAVKSVIGWLWKNEPGGAGRWAGWQIPCQKLNAWVCPTWHPSAILRGETSNKGKPEPENAVRRMQFENHLKAACELKGRPWKEVPNYKKNVHVEYDPVVAAKYLRLARAYNKPIAFDFETDRLKPDHPDAQIVCCSISAGKIGFAFPWQREAVTAMKELLVSPTPKIGYHMKFEDRWVRKHLGIRVRNWVFDGMLAAHVLDNRPGIKSLKFQSFVRLGQESYNDYIEPFLEGEGGNGQNRIKEMDKEGLLTYCGMDSLLEYKVARRMAQELEIEL